MVTKLCLESRLVNGENAQKTLEQICSRGGVTGNWWLEIPEHGRQPQPGDSKAALKLASNV